MKKIIFSLMACTCLLACGGASKKQQAQIESLQSKAGDLLSKLKTAENRAAALESEKADLAARLEELDGKLKSSAARVDSLSKSNQDLSKSMESNKGELAKKVKEVIAEKDELSRRLGETEKEKLAAEKTKAQLAARLQRVSIENSALRKERDEAAAALGAERSSDEAKQQERRAKLAAVREQMGQLADVLLKELQSEKAALEQSGETISLTLQEPLLFEPKQAKLTENGVAVLERVGAALHKLSPRKVVVEGHADNTPIKWELFGRFTSHWDLSAGRATAVARHLHEHGGLDPKRLTAAGFGEFRPVKPNDSPAGREANRRVVLVVE